MGPPLSSKDPYLGYLGSTSANSYVNHQHENDGSRKLRDLPEKQRLTADSENMTVELAMNIAQLESDEYARTAAAWWRRISTLFTDNARSFRAKADAMTKHWDSAAAEKFFQTIGGSLWSLDKWAATASANAAQLDALAGAISTYQTEMRKIWIEYQRQLTEASKIVVPAPYMGGGGASLAAQRTGRRIATMSATALMRAQLRKLEGAYVDAHSKLDLGYSSYTGLQNALDVPDGALQAAMDKLMQRVAQEMASKVGQPPRPAMPSMPSSPSNPPHPPTPPVPPTPPAPPLPPGLSPALANAPAPPPTPPAPPIPPTAPASPAGIPPHPAAIPPPLQPPVPPASTTAPGTPPSVPSRPGPTPPTAPGRGPSPLSGRPGAPSPGGPLPPNPSAPPGKSMPPGKGGAPTKNLGGRNAPPPMMPPSRPQPTSPKPPSAKPPGGNDVVPPGTPGRPAAGANALSGRDAARPVTRPRPPVFGEQQLPAAGRPGTSAVPASALAGRRRRDDDGDRDRRTTSPDPMSPNSTEPNGRPAVPPAVLLPTNPATVADSTPLGDALAGQVSRANISGRPRLRGAAPETEETVREAMRPGLDGASADLPGRTLGPTPPDERPQSPVRQRPYETNADLAERPWLPPAGPAPVVVPPPEVVPEPDPGVLGGGALGPRP